MSDIILREGHTTAFTISQIWTASLLVRHPHRLRILKRNQAFCLYYRLQLAQCLQSQEGVLDWAKLLPDGGVRGEALAFLATSVKDHGAVLTCIHLFQ